MDREESGFSAMISTTADPTSGLTVHVVTGAFSVLELRDAAVAFVKDAPTPLALWDFSEADFSQLPAAALAGVFDGARPYAENRKGGRTALLFQSAVGFGLGRMSEALAEVREYPYLFKAFWDRESAMAWLKAAEVKEVHGAEVDGVA